MQGGLGDLLGGSTPAAATSYPDITAYSQEGGGVSIRFTFSKPVASQPEITEILATTVNNGLADISEFSMQVREGGWITQHKRWIHRMLLS